VRNPIWIARKSVDRAALWIGRRRTLNLSKKFNTARDSLPGLHSAETLAVTALRRRWEGRESFIGLREEALRSVKRPLMAIHFQRV